MLLGSFDFDDNGNATENTGKFLDQKYLEYKYYFLLVIVPVDLVSSPQNKTLLDDDSIPFEDAPIDLSINLSVALQSAAAEEKHHQDTNPTKDIVAEFDVIKDDEEDDEFALLAAESLTRKPPSSQVILPPVDIQAQQITEAFEVEFEQTEFEIPEGDDIDPFDTTFAENILPGKAELKIIEDEILNTIQENVPSFGETYSQIIKSTVSIHLTNPTGERESISSLDRVDESCLNSLQPIHRDLLGGSNTDLSNIGDDPIVPNQPTVDDSLSDYSDPFDTSLVEQVTAPGQAELKFIEKEILGEVTITRTLSDPDFNPRDEEPSKHQAHRPDILQVNSVKSVAFAIPSPNVQPDLLATGDEQSKHSKPLTPYYVRDNSIPEQALDNETDVNIDPFDTSFVATAPGKVELKLIENEFISQKPPQLERNLSDEDFDPRAEEKSAPAQQIQQIQTVQPSIPVNLSLPLKQDIPKPDLLAANDEVSAKVLTPAVEQQSSTFEELYYSDPFDTSIASNILPGKTELKLLENELINAQAAPIKRVLTDPEFDPRHAVEEPPQDLLATTEDQVSCKPLTPVDYQVSFDVGGDDDFDPFDTSVAENLAPGKTELKLLESELI